MLGRVDHLGRQEVVDAGDSMEGDVREEPGRPILYGTTFTFLERFGLTSLDDLPALSSQAAGLVAAGSPDGDAVPIPDAG